jgi:hypothetical protein
MTLNATWRRSSRRTCSHRSQCDDRGGAEGAGGERRQRVPGAAHAGPRGHPGDAGGAAAVRRVRDRPARPRLFRFTGGGRPRPTGQALLLHRAAAWATPRWRWATRALDAILRLHPGPRSTFLTCEPHHVETALRHFELQHRQTMIRMQVTAETFRPNYDTPVRRLSGRESREINALYRTEGVPSFYTPRQVDDSVYFGADADGALVAIAGTHVISSSNAIAVVGNVYTHPAYRGRHSPRRRRAR